MLHLFKIKYKTGVDLGDRNTGNGIIRKTISTVRNKWVAIMVRLTSGLSIKALKIGLVLFVFISTGIILSIIHTSVFQSRLVNKTAKIEIAPPQVNAGSAKNLEELSKSYLKIKKYRMILDSLDTMVKGQKCKDNMRSSLKLGDSLRQQNHKN